HGGAEGDVDHEIAVHDVQVQPFRPGVFGPSPLGLNMGKLGGEQRGDNERCVAIHGRPSMKGSGPKAIASPAVINATRRKEVSASACGCAYAGEWKKRKTPPSSSPATSTSCARLCARRARRQSRTKCPSARSLCARVM